MTALDQSRPAGPNRRNFDPQEKERFGGAKIDNDRAHQGKANIVSALIVRPSLFTQASRLAFFISKARLASQICISPLCWKTRPSVYRRRSTPATLSLVRWPVPDIRIVRLVLLRRIAISFRRFQQVQGLNAKPRKFKWIRRIFLKTDFDRFFVPLSRFF